MGQTGRDRRRNESIEDLSMERRCRWGAVVLNQVGGGKYVAVVGRVWFSAKA
jgi:hypothetical protein